MPEENGSSQRKISTSEKTEAKFFEEAERLKAAIASLGAEYEPPNEIAELDHITTKLTESLPLRTAHLDNLVAEEAVRNERENIYKPLNSVLTNSVNYAKSAGKPQNEIDALASIAREIKGVRATPTAATGEGENVNRRSVANTAFASRAEKYALFVEQYEAMNIKSEDDEFKAAAHRTRLAQMRDANTAVINAQAASNSSERASDAVAYTDADSLRNSCLAAKSYLKAKPGFKETYKKISKLRFELPKRLR